MSLLRFFRGDAVRLRVIKHLQTDLRDPRDTHKLRRIFECRKVPNAPQPEAVSFLLRRQAE